MRELTADEMMLVAGGRTTWEEDTDGDGKIDTIWVDNNSDGYIGEGDGAIYVEPYYDDVDSYAADAMADGFDNWLQNLGWTLLVGGAATGAQVAAGTTTISAALSAALAPVTLATGVVTSAHQLVFDTYGNIDFSVVNEIQTNHYADAFGMYNPYRDGPDDGGGDDDYPEMPDH